MLKYLLLLFLLTGGLQSGAQVPRDSVKIRPVQELIAGHPLFNFDGQAVELAVEERRDGNRSDGLFYYLLGLLLCFAMLRLIFGKYFETMFTLFFRATLRQQQLREQMLQAPLPALLMNIFTVISFGTYCALLSRHVQLPVADNFWKGLVFAVAVMGAIYLGKYIFLTVIGWTFGISQVTGTYLFIVFLANKMLGIFLLPMIVLLAFPPSYLLTTILTASYILVGGMFVYRFVISYRPVRSEIKLSRLQFFLYLCAFEIAPLLLIYKVLLSFEVSSF